MLTRMGKLDGVVLRLTNVYGPRLGLHAVGQGFLSVFLRRLLAGEGIEIFGDGQQLRDPVYSEDVVEAFLLAGQARHLPHRMYNVGGLEALTVAEIACIMRDEVAPASTVRFRPFPPDHLAFDIGSYRSDTRRIEAGLGWRPRTEFREGIQETVRWFAGVPSRR
jgi:nucleoside-diphosphate-sugar epimerase